MADQDAPYLPISPAITPPVDLQSALDGDTRADVVIVGGGFTGLSTALALRKSGVDVLILEREFCGFGASSRNAGHLTPTIGKDMPTMLMLLGRERTEELVRFADYCVARTERLIADNSIHCDYRPSGNIMSVVHARQEKRLREAAALARGVGAPVRFLEAAEMRERGIPPAFLCGALEQAGGTLSPGKLVSALRRIALEAGVRIREGTQVLKIGHGRRQRILTANGAVRTDRTLLASNAWTRGLAPAGRRIAPVYVTLFETAPLSEEQRESLGGWRGGEGIYTAHESLESYRLTASGTIVGGAKSVRYPYGGRPLGSMGPDAGTQGLIAGAFRDRFPQLSQLRIAHYWGGWIAMTLNFLPYVGGDGRLFHAIGYNGHGVAQACAMGEILADIMLDRRNPWSGTIVRKLPPLPPEPLRWLLIRGMIGVVNAIDRRTDRQLRARATAGH